MPKLPKKRSDHGPQTLYRIHKVALPELRPQVERPAEVPRQAQDELTIAGRTYTVERVVRLDRYVAVIVE